VLVRVLVRPGGTALVLVVVIEGDLPDGSRKGDGQLAAWAHVAEHRGGERGAVLDAEKPGLDDRGHVLRSPRYGQWPAAHHHEHDGGGGGVNRLEQLRLHAGQIDIGATRGLATHVARFAQYQHGDVRLLRGGHGLGEPRGRRVGDATALRVHDAHATPCTGFDPLERVHGVLRVAAAGPGTERRGLVI